VCPITNDVMKDPVRACDGLAYEREAIEVSGCSRLFLLAQHTPATRHVALYQVLHMHSVHT
jgi:hypothetical protein